MRIVVTGGAGVLGSHFVRNLVHGAFPELAGSEVTVLDKLTYAGSMRNLSAVRDNTRLRLVRGDICDRELVTEVLAGTDLVVHFAAESHVDRSIADAGAFVRTNVLGTQTLLDAALDARVRKFVHVSTDKVYGSIPDGGSWDENTPVSPTSPYAASKTSSDLLALAAHRTHGLPVCVTRGSNTYGSHQHPEKVVPRFITRLLTGKTVPLYGDGSQTREWLHVDDHCRGVSLVAAAGEPGEVYHVGGGTELTNKQLTERLLSLLGADWSRVRQVTDRKGHDLRYALDSRKITAKLGYAPSVRFEEGLAQTVAWYRNHRDWWEPLLQP